MKNLIAKLKNQDYKQLAIDHGEKFLLGGVALFALIAWAGTRWLPYDKNPEELSSVVRQTRTSVEQGAWPAAQQQEVPLGDLSERVKEEYAQINPQRYTFGTGFIWPLENRKTVVTREPNYFAVNNLQANAAHVVLVEQGKPIEAEPLTNNGIGGNNNNNNNNGNPRRPIRPRGIFDPEAAAAEAAQAAEDALENSTQMEVAYGPAVPVARRVVGVRGVFELRRQLQEIIEKSSLMAAAPESQLLEVADFELQRQESSDGGETWSGWEPVDIREAIDVLTKASVWAEEVVANQIVEQHITMSLPGLAFGEWGPLATHEDVKNYHLTSEGRRLQEELDQQIIEEGSDLEQREPSNPFEILQADMRGGREQLLNNPNRTRVFDQLRENYSQDDLRQVQAAGNVLLFRYLDFTVDPGFTYRYRVRLKLYNPNRNRLPYEVESPDVVAGEFRFTPWSDPTPPTTVPEDTEYFVQHIDAGRPGRPAATFDMFQWYSKVGTLVAAQLKAEFGSMIGGEVKATVTHPPSGENSEPYGTLVDEDVPFLTRDVLVDVAEVPRLDASLHADLGLNADIIEQALVADRGGRLVSLDPTTRKAGRDRAEKRLRDQWRDMQVRRQEENQDDLDLDARRFEEGANDAPPRRGDNPARRRGRGQVQRRR